MYRTHKIKLNTNNKQRTYFAKCAGVARFTYNWALSRWKEEYESGNKTSSFGLKKEFNSIKGVKFPFVKEVTKWAPERAFENLDKAFKGFFKKRTGYHKFKKKGVHDSFYISGTVLKISGYKVKIPKIGWVRMTEQVRFLGKISCVTISKKVGKWFASFLIDLGEVTRENQSGDFVGIDLGISKLATLSDGTVFENFKTTNKYEKGLRRLNKSLARKKKDSSNWRKVKDSLGIFHHKISCIRSDIIQKMTTTISKNYLGVCLEDLSSRNMMKNRKLSKSLADASFGEIKRQLLYKVGKVILVNKWFPSTKLCSNCGQLHTMPLSKRVFECTCGLGPVDRDLNAARNILLEGIRQGLPDFKPVEMTALTNSVLVSETIVCEAGNQLKGAKGLHSNFL